MNIRIFTLGLLGTLIIPIVASDSGPRPTQEQQENRQFEQEMESKQQSAIINALKEAVGDDSQAEEGHYEKPLDADCTHVLVAAFQEIEKNPNHASKKLSQEELTARVEALPNGIARNIGMFAGSHFVAQNLEKLIPAMIHWPKNSPTDKDIFHHLDQARGWCSIEGPRCAYVRKNTNYSHGSSIVRPSDLAGTIKVIEHADSFAAYRLENGCIVFKVPPRTLKKLESLTRAQLRFATNLFEQRKQQIAAVQATIDARIATDLAHMPHIAEETEIDNAIRRILIETPQGAERTALNRAKIINFTPEQTAILGSIADNEIAHNLQNNYRSDALISEGDALIAEIL